MSEKIRYLTFPVAILKDSLIDIKQCVNNAMYYCLYDYYLRYGGSKEIMIKEAGSFYGIKWGNKVSAFDKGKLLFESLPDKSPKTSISIAMIFDFYKNEKTEFEIITFLAFAAIRSILQRDRYKKMSNESLIGRMSGNSRKGEPINPLLNKYTKRYQLDKIKKELEINWGLKLYGKHTRGYYVSFKMDFESLMYQVEKRKKKYRLMKLQQEKKAAMEEVKRRFEEKDMDWKTLIEDRLLKNYLPDSNGNCLRGNNLSKL